MHKIIASSRFDSKPSYTVGTEPAANITIGDGELAAYIGTNVVAVNNQRCISALIQCRDALIEAQWPDGALDANFAAILAPGKEGVIVGNAPSPVAGSEDHVAIAYGGDFAPVQGRSQIFVGHVDRLIETFQEQILKFS